MMTLDIKELDDIYTGYNYEIKSKKHRSVRVYSKRLEIYNAVEIVPLNQKYKYSKILKEYSELGYATKVRGFNSLEEVENTLFKEYFLDSQFYQINKNKYSDYIKKQISLLPDGSEYTYIDIPYDYIIYENQGKLLDKGSSAGRGRNNVINRILEWIEYKEKPVFVILEAAAGFGKTCTAFELLHKLVDYHNRLLPFFIELSKNRTARVFKHIFLSEIEKLFPEGISPSIVLNEIKKGNIPLIVDGFDELLSKDLSKKAYIESDVGNMLSTIMDLLINQSKVLITSRKTAIFDGESFNEWASNISRDFIIARYVVKEPLIEDWLGNDKIKEFEQNDYDISKLSNPVLLNYIRNIDTKEIKKLIESETNGLYNKYFDFLLTREIKRQNLRIEKEKQLDIFRALARFMVELDFRADTKEGIKDFFREYCKEIVDECILLYQKSERPSIEDIFETLSNHVFLDRKEQGFIGFINDFIFGALVADGLIKSEYHLKDENSEILLGELNCSLAVESFKINNNLEGQKLWSVFKKPNFSFLPQFYFNIDIVFKKSITQDYYSLQLENRTFRYIKFSKYEMDGIQFFNCSFENCKFEAKNFTDAIFQNCSFKNCDLINENRWNETVIIENCKSDNGILKRKSVIKYNNDSIHFKDVENDVDILTILEQFYNPLSGAPKNVSINKLMSFFNENDPKFIRKKLKNLLSKNFLHQQGDIFFISKEGRTFYSENK